MTSSMMNQSALIEEPKCFEGEVKLYSLARLFGHYHIQVSENIGKDHCVSDGINSIKKFYLQAILLLRPLLLAQGNGARNPKHC